MIQFYGSTHAGLVREVNQDSYAHHVHSDNLAFAVLCDGMGGENGGHVASQTVTSHVCEVLGRDLHPDMTPTTLTGVMQSAIAGANALVYQRAVEDASLKGMGTTLIIAVFWNQILHVAYVGDSRVYCVSHGDEQQLTKDHTVVQMLVDIGEITQQDAENHPKRHYITRAVGVGPDVTPDYLEHTISPGDTVLLCSDGLYQYLERGALKELLPACLERSSADSLIDLANSRGGTDNITAIVAAVGPAGDDAGELPQAH